MGKELQEILQVWCEKKMRDPSAAQWLSSNAFSAGGHWRKAHEPSVAMRTELAGDVSAPDAWGMFVQEKQDARGFRRFWHTDLTIKQDELGGYRMFVSVSYSLDFGYIGWEPQLLLPTAPNFVGFCLEAKSFTVRTGDLKVGKQVLSVLPNGSQKLSKVIFDSRRNLPVVLITGGAKSYNLSRRSVEPPQVAAGNMLRRLGATGLWLG